MCIFWGGVGGEVGWGVQLYKTSYWLKKKVNKADGKRESRRWGKASQWSQTRGFYKNNNDNNNKKKIVDKELVQSLLFDTLYDIILDSSYFCLV